MCLKVVIMLFLVPVLYISPMCAGPAGPHGSGREALPIQEEAVPPGMAFPGQNWNTVLKYGCVLDPETFLP